MELERPAKTTLSRRLTRQSQSFDRTLKLGTIATLNGRFKGIQTVISALSLARHRFPSLTYHVLGGGDPGPWQKLIHQHRLEDIVRMDGSVPSGEPVIRWLDDIDVYIQPSLKEGLPRALIEAMSRGCPAIGSSAGGIPELLENTDIFTAGGVDELASLLARKLPDRQWMEESARKNWKLSASFEKAIIEGRRDEFYRHFASYVANPK
ncbi:MAG: glycosyltransferase family 4 protein [Rhizobiaceae bacterium]